MIELSFLAVCLSFSWQAHVLFFVVNKLGCCSLPKADWNRFYRHRPSPSTAQRPRPGLCPVPWPGTQAAAAAWAWQTAGRRLIGPTKQPKYSACRPAALRPIWTAEQRNVEQKRQLAAEASQLTDGFQSAYNSSNIVASKVVVLLQSTVNIDISRPNYEYEYRYRYSIVEFNVPLDIL